MLKFYLQTFFVVQKVEMLLQSEYNRLLTHQSQLSMPEQVLHKNLIALTVLLG